MPKWLLDRPVVREPSPFGHRENCGGLFTGQRPEMVRLRRVSRRTGGPSIAATIRNGQKRDEAPSSDEYCPHCDNHFVLEAVTPTPALQLEGEDARVDARMLKDDRVRTAQQRTIFDVKDAADRLG
ncbi:MAG: hypothetical protein Q9181_000415 [Wetmoreana brouardii]